MPARSDSAAASVKVDRPEGRIATEVAANASRENPTVTATVVPEDQAQSPSWNREATESPSLGQQVHTPETSRQENWHHRYRLSQYTGSPNEDGECFRNEV